MPYSPTTWVNNGAPPISAANLNHIELALQAAYPVYNVLDSAYGAVGNGVADDTTAIQAAVTAAQGTRGIVYSPPGYTYVVSSALTVTAECTIDFSWSTIQKKSTFPNNLNATGAVFNMSAANAVVRRVTIDGNRSGGAGGGGIYSTGASCRLENCVVRHTNWHGIVCDTGSLEAVMCEASDCGAIGSNSNGFVVWSGGTLRTYNCYAASNPNVGFYYDSNAATGCRLEGRAYQNNLAGAQLLCNGGHCPYFLCEQSSSFGLILGTAVAVSGWTFDYVETNNTGVAIPGYAQNNAGTGIELYGADHCNFGTVISKANLGYGLALATNGTVGCTYNTFHSVTCDQTGAADGDPGIAITGGSKNNTFGTAVVRYHTVGVRIGEGTSSNDSNVFGTLFISNNGAGGLTLDGGSRNSFQNVVSRDNNAADLTLTSKAVVTFAGALATTTLNTIGFLDHDDTGSDHTTVPPFLVYCDATATNNTVLDGFARASRVGAIDLNGGNYIYLRRPQRRTSLSTFDTGETWSSSTDQTTNQLFMEGSSGKHVVGGTDAYTNSQRTGLSLNLSTMANSDWFRMFAYIENKADFNNVTSAVQLRLVTTAGNYFMVDWNSNMLNNGAQWLYARKGGATTTGTPAWSSITTLQVLVWGHLATAAVSFDDLIIADTKWDRTSTLGQNNTPAVITVGASPYAYQNVDGVPLNVMVSGGTVSAIDYSQDANTWYSQGQTAGIFIINPNDYTRVTYTAAPAMTKVPTR